jgi:hypothetical protein
MHNSKTHLKEDLLGRIFDLGVREGYTILIWGYAEGYNFSLQVLGYQKIENPWFKVCCKKNLALGVPGDNKS